VRTRQILAAMRELQIQRKVIFNEANGTDLAFITMPFKDILTQSFVVDENINALFCRFILTDESKSEELAIRSMKNFPLLFDSQHNQFIKSCLRLKRQKAALQKMEARDQHKESLDEITRSFSLIIGSLTYSNILILVEIYSQINVPEEIVKVIREKIEYLKTRGKDKRDSDVLTAPNSSSNFNWQLENTRKTWRTSKNALRE